MTSQTKVNVTDRSSIPTNPTFELQVQTFKDEQTSGPTSNPYSISNSISKQDKFQSSILNSIDIQIQNQIPNSIPTNIQIKNLTLEISLPALPLSKEADFIFLNWLRCGVVICEFCYLDNCGLLDLWIVGSLHFGIVELVLAT